MQDYGNENIGSEMNIYWIFGKRENFIFGD
jgi:beta-lactamase class D